MKTTLFDIKGKKKSEIELPTLFGNEIREDIALKYFESRKQGQPYAHYVEAGKRHSASGTISHKRHDWKGHYGRGLSRLPRKTMWRRGDQFFWIGAEVSSTRGGRRAHGPKGSIKIRKINKKEAKIAMISGFAATGNKDYLMERYGSIEKVDLKLPLVIESKLDKIKSKDLLAALKAMFGNIAELILKKKDVRAGKGKIRNRKYKSNAGLLLVTGTDENVKIKGIDVIPIHEVMISDLYPLGRLTVYTEKAIQQLGGVKQ